MLSIFTTGDTWYGKYGFIPFDIETNKSDSLLVHKYNKNKLIVSTTKVKDTKVKKYILEAITKLKIKQDISDFSAQLDKFSDHSIKDFLLHFLIKFNKTCLIFEHFYKKLANDL